MTRVYGGVLCSCCVGEVESMDSVDWMVCHSVLKYCRQRLLVVLCQFSYYDGEGISDYEHTCLSVF